MITYRPPLRKRILKHAFVRGTLTLLIALCIRSLFLLSRRTYRVPDATRPYTHGERPAIFCFWHGRILFMPILTPKARPMKALVSRHGDGALIADLMRWFGVDSVRGSSSKGAHSALRGLIEATAGEANIAISPDGPRGPHQVAAPGAVWLAAQSGLPIIPVSATSTRRKHAKSWDAFTVPLPFGHIICEAGEPMHIPADSTDTMVETYRIELERRLSTLTSALDSEAARTGAA